MPDCASKIGVPRPVCPWCDVEAKYIDTIGMVHNSIRMLVCHACGKRYQVEAEDVRQYDCIPLKGNKQ